MADQVVQVRERVKQILDANPQVSVNDAIDKAIAEIAGTAEAHGREVSLPGAPSGAGPTVAAEASVLGNIAPGRQQDLRPRALVAAQKELIASADKSGGSSRARFLMNLKLTPEGKISAAQEMYGKDKVVVLVDEDRELDQLVILGEGANGAPLLIGPRMNQGVPAGRILPEMAATATDVVNPIIEAGPGVLGGVIGAAGGPGTAVALGAAGDLVGSGVAQGLAALAPGEDNLTGGQRLAMGATNVGAGLFMEGVGAGARLLKGAARGGKGVLRGVGQRTAAQAGDEPVKTALDVIGDGRFDVELPNMAPQRAPSSLTAAQLETAGDALAKSGQQKLGSEVVGANKAVTGHVGIEPTAGQLTGDPLLLRKESLMRQHPATVQKMEDLDLGQKRAGSKFFRKQLDAISKSGASPADAAEQGAGAYKGHIGRLNADRAKVADDLFGRAEKLNGGARNIPLGETLDAMKALKGRFASDASSGPTGRILSEMTKIEKKIKKVSKGTGNTTITGLKNSLHDWSERSAAGDAIADLSPDQNRYIAQEIFGALRRDLDNAADSTLTGQAGVALKKARGEYARMSGEIEAERSSLLDNLLKQAKTDSEDVFIGKLISDASDKKVVKAMAVLNRADPLVARRVQRAALERMSEKAWATGNRAGAEEVLSPAAFNRAFGGGRQFRRLNAIFAGNPGAAVEISKLTRAFEIIGDSAGTGGSQTAPMQWLMESLKSTNPLAPVQSLQKISAAANVAFRMRSIHKVLVEPAGRDALLKLAAPKRSLKLTEANKLAAKLLAIANRDDSLETSMLSFGTANDVQHPVASADKRQQP